MKTLRFIFWNIVYLFRNPWRQESLEESLKRMGRCWNPWRKFQPYCHRNESLREWEIWFSDEPSYTVPNQQITADVHIGQDTGNIVGMDIWDQEALDKVAKPGQDRPPPFSQKDKRKKQ